MSDTPTDASKSGDNSYYLHCESFGCRRAYAVCLRVIDAFEAGKPRWQDPGCNKAIQAGPTQCPALKMRSEERAAGKPIFFEPRGRLEPKVEVQNLQPTEVSVFDPRWKAAQQELGKSPKKAATRESQLREPIKRDTAPKAAPSTPITGAMLLKQPNLHAELVNRLMREETKK